MQINFEDFVLKFDSSTEKINKFLNIKRIKNINFDLENSKIILKLKNFLAEQN